MSISSGLYLSDNIGRNIQILTKAHEWTQKELSLKIGESGTGQVIQKWETGRTAIPADAIVKLAKVFNVSCDLLLTGVESKNIPTHWATSLSNFALDELVVNKPLAHVINLLLNPEFSYDDIPIGELILLTIGDSIEHNYVVGEFPLYEESDKKLKRFVEYSEINNIQILHYLNALRRMVENGKKSKR